MAPLREMGWYAIARDERHWDQNRISSFDRERVRNHARVVTGASGQGTNSDGAEHAETAGLRDGVKWRDAAAE